MLITISRRFLIEILPKAGDVQSDDALCRLVAEHYRLGDHLPLVRIVDDSVLIEFEEQETPTTTSKLRRIAQLAETGRYAEAKRLIAEVVADGTTESEIFRIHGQILFDEGNFDEALNQFIDALKWNPENVAALIMVGNIYAKQKRDIKSAQLFFERALTVDPDYVTALTNYGSVLAEAGRTSDARRYFERALELQPLYPQAHLGMSIVLEADGDLVSAFEHIIHALKQVQERSSFQTFLREEAQRIAESYASSFDRDTFFEPIIQSLTERSGKPVRLVLDPSISTPARIEIAEHRGVAEHIVRYKAVTPTLPHYFLHELMHLDFVIEARAGGRNKKFVSFDEHRNRFMVDAAPMLPKIEKEGLAPEVSEKFLHSIFLGINNQIFNAPIDLSIEHEIHSRYPEMRPIQMLALLEMQEMAIRGANLEQVRRITPPSVFAANVTMSLTHAMQIRDMYGIDETSRFNAKNLIKRATGLYDEWQTKQETWTAGDEYQLIESWGNSLGLTGYFTLRDEQETTNTPLDSILQQILEDPYDQRDEQKDNERWDKDTGSAIRIDVVSYCVEALRFIACLSDSQIQEIGFELALVGRQGFDTTSSVRRYRFAGIPERSFSGLEAIAWMYCFWQRIDPSVDLGADFGKEYSLAKQKQDQR